jgi:hypothetical protein
MAEGRETQHKEGERRVETPSNNNLVRSKLKTACPRAANRPMAKDRSLDSRSPLNSG